ncbi:hypothetical protein [Dawidia soli]|uniref:Uncharacterized protein n=1 Tax=Dawidia soli TaxID=2782352 RepID=A0AAP2GKC6_9BACT|nr:hypothetical protein [Dawidia soli]MBT1689480.1 hypothetical protein [Dawidia soli]
MHWQELKDEIYFEDGSLRDIYVLDITRADWQKWIDLVNRKYTVEFYDARTGITNDKIDFKLVKEYWDSNGEREVIQACIKIGSTNIMCYFFDSSEIENDLNPKEFRSKTDHDSLVDYLDDIAAALNKEVYVTNENTNDSILIKRVPLHDE